MPSAFARRALAVPLVFAAGLLVLRAQDLPAPAQGPSSPEAIREFLLRAKVVRSREVGKGVTGIMRLTLEDGGFSHDAAFQVIDERKMVMQFAGGATEFGFADSYHFNIAGYELAVRLGLGQMVPVTVERSWRGQTGSLSWWMPFKFHEEERLKQGAKPPDADAWNAQMHRVRVFSALIYDTDRNLGNILIGDDWTIWMIDFTRAFRRHAELQKPGDLIRCDRRLFERLQTLQEDEIRSAVGRHLTGPEIEAVVARRDVLVAHFRTLIAERGEAAVLY